MYIYISKKTLAWWNSIFQHEYFAENILSSSSYYVYKNTALLLEINLIKLIIIVCETCKKSETWDWWEIFSEPLDNK